MFIAEPVQGSGGVIPPQDDYFPRIREICDHYQVLLVADEVITGFGRTGTMFGLQHWGVEPDLMQFAKGITSGYFPLGGIGVSDEIAAAMNDSGQPWMHAYTYSGHPVGCAIGLAMLDIIEGEDFPGQAARKGAALLGALREALDDHPNVGDIRGLGLMCGVELVADRASKRPFEASEKVGARVLAAMIDRGLVTRIRGDVLCLAPPIVIDDDLLHRIPGVIREAVDAVL
jgi:adenosylmethionine-8-amino-7-oxononanoate aminotransferase